jgi:hypothetical protein
VTVGRDQRAQNGAPKNDFPNHTPMSLCELFGTTFCSIFGIAVVRVTAGNVRLLNRVLIRDATNSRDQPVGAASKRVVRALKRRPKAF